MKRLMAVDGTNVMVRSLMVAPDLSVDGEPTGALTVFINTIVRYVREQAPTHLVVCWDKGGSAYRTRVFAQYKANRVQPTQEQDDARHLLRDQTRRFLDAAGIAQAIEEGVEADDLIAHYWRRRMLWRWDEFVILSGDKDLLQLVDSEDVWQVRPGVDPLVWGQYTIEAKFGCYGQRLTMAKALAGDAGDGVPGVSRVGMKTAVKLLSKHDWSWGATVADPKIEPHREAAEMSLRLVGLRERRVDVGRPPDPTPTPRQATDQLVDFLSRYEMRGALDRAGADTFWG